MTRVVAYQPSASSSLPAYPAVRYTPTVVQATSPRPVSAARIESSVAPIAWKRVVGVQAGDRPLLVWISDANGDQTVERRTFDDESVRLAARAFRTVRVQPEFARTDPYLATYAKSTPVLVVFSADLKRAAAMPGSSLYATTALDTMRAAARAEEGIDLEVAVRKARSLLGEEQSVEAQKAGLVHGTAAETSQRADLDRRLVALRTEEATLFKPAPAPITR